MTHNVKHTLKALDLCNKLVPSKIFFNARVREQNFINILAVIPSHKLRPYTNWNELDDICKKNLEMATDGQELVGYRGAKMRIIRWLKNGTKKTQNGTPI